MVVQVQKHVIMQVKLEWRQYLAKITYCYHYGLKIHHSSSSKDSPDAGFKPSRDNEKKVTEEPGKEGGNPSEEVERVNHVEDVVWMNLQGQKILLWKLYDSCGVYFVRFQNMHIYMLVEKTYYLTPATITEMLNKKLQAEYWNEMCYQLLKLMTKLGRIVGIKRLPSAVEVTTAGYGFYYW
ncbi:hypothetical protein Tco_1158355 [Tanacetum coccineum]